MTEPQRLKCPTMSRLYEDGKVVAENFAFEEIPQLLAKHRHAALWLDLLDPDELDLQLVAPIFGLHPLAVEDAVHDHQRPKLDRYRNHLFMNVYAVSVGTDGPTPVSDKQEISSFITERAFITVRKSAGDFGPVLRRWDDEPELAKHGVSFLVYGLLDVVVDGQFAGARALDEAMDKTEDAMLEEGGAPRPVRMYGFGLRKALVHLRRSVAPMPDVISTLLRLELDLVVDGLKPYFRDVDDHARRATETLDQARDRINGLLDADLNEQSNNLNVTTRKLAAWAAIIAVPTAVTGYFGQNVPYWGYETTGGFLVSSIVIVVSGVLLYWYLKRRGWL
ncbi:magnesium transporter CorA family protein [Symbioplanes lichenis]|uniref:magnesium transporter CorA family protein n=1 Tax=Symbioplanes lichenis TaxID=1629072 RepID=UPI00273A08EE|nr:magnesium transporter CorA family protein [Actinoplanes lichenis]